MGNDGGALGRGELGRVIHELEAARRETELQKEHLVSLFTQAPTPIVILRGPTYVIELVNAFTCQLWGRTQEQLLGKALFEALPELEGQGFRTLLDGVRATGERHVSKEMPAKIDRHQDGALDTAYLNFVYSPMRGLDGEIDGILVMAFEVTDEVVGRQKMEALRADAESANRTKEEFLAMLGHELRNPLSPMLTALQLMRLRGNESREQDILERQVSHLTRLVDDLLDVSRVTRGRVVLQKRKLELAEVLDRAIEIVSPLLEQRRHVLDVEVPRHGLAVYGDRSRLAQVFSNLLTNAAKYSEPGSRIGVSAQRDGNWIRARVKDDGAGIAPEMTGRVFDSFIQQAQTIERSRGGLGLGLAIVRSLVELHGGAVSAYSAGAGKGSEFCVELPVQLSESIDLPSSAQLPPVEHAQRKRILVVDDNQDAAETLKDVLTTLGHTVVVAHDGPAALRAANGFNADVALLDIGLPVMDGYELAQRLRTLPIQRRPVRLIAVTGYGQESDRKRSREAGFAHHLVKPVDLKALQQVVQEP